MISSKVHAFTDIATSYGTDQFPSGGVGSNKSLFVNFTMANKNTSKAYVKISYRIYRANVGGGTNVEKLNGYKLPKETTFTTTGSGSDLIFLNPGDYIDFKCDTASSVDVDINYRESDLVNSP